MVTPTLTLFCQKGLLTIARAAAPVLLRPALATAPALMALVHTGLAPTGRGPRAQRSVISEIKGQ